MDDLRDRRQSCPPRIKHSPVVSKRNETRKIRETNETPATRKGCSEDLRERRRDVSAQKKRNLLVVGKYKVVSLVLIPVWNAIF